MSRNAIYLAIASLLFWLSVGSRSVADTASETKLREALRNTMLQLRTAQNDRAALQASQAENEEKLKRLTAQVEGLNKQAAAAEKTAADQQAEMAKFKEALQRWEGAYKQAVEIANVKEAARAKLANDVIYLQRRVADQQSRNAAMFRTASEILTRYEHFGLGEALAAKEPFVGVTRVKLENLVQEYEDKLVDERIRDVDGEKRGATNETQQPRGSSGEQPNQKAKP
jgi:chromosome segregation ATPase